MEGSIRKLRSHLKRLLFEYLRTYGPLKRDNCVLGPGICSGEQSHSYYQLRRQADLKPLGAHRSGLPYFFLARLRQPGKIISQHCYIFESCASMID